MWTRVELKTKAKKVLSKTYGMSLVISVIIIIFGSNVLGTSGGSSNSNNQNHNNQYRNYSIDRGFEYNDPITNKPRYITPFNAMIEFFARIFSTGLGIVAFIFLLIKLFIGNVIAIGGYRYFINTARGYDEDLTILSYGFKDGRMSNIFLTMLLRDIYTFLWSLLLVIPGVIKSYSYRMVPHILAENPYMSPNDAIYLSQSMMNGEKWNVFVLDLSFILWKLLAAVIPGVGDLLLSPYLFATDAQLYLKLLEKRNI